ncbi:hypothetical protein EON65_22075 [archaeon]|nr:MAG: hypothetical protein EON65_22075 [archaeon]
MFAEKRDGLAPIGNDLIYASLLNVLQDMNFFAYLLLLMAWPKLLEGLLAWHSPSNALLHTMTGEHLSIGLHARKIDELESTDDISSLFGEWEREEKELQIELERKRQEEEREEYVAPKYLQELMDLLEDNAVEEDMPVSKLPTLVVMGRPNTGKSTLANRIASTFQVNSHITSQNTLYRLAMPIIRTQL